MPDIYNWQYPRPHCEDSTLPIDVTVSGAAYTTTTDQGVALTSANDEPSDEFFYGNPSALTPMVSSVVDTATGQPNGPLGEVRASRSRAPFFYGVTGVTFTDAGCTNDPGYVMATVPASDLTVTDGTTITLTSPSDIDDDWNSSCNGEIDTDVQVQVATPTERRELARAPSASPRTCSRLRRSLPR